MHDFTLTILGCHGSFPMEGPSYVEFGGATSCYILRSEDYAVVIDCGTGFCAAAPLLEGCTKVDVLLTHLHYDHILGFLYPEGIPAGRRPACLYIHRRGRNRTPLAFIRTPYWPAAPQHGTLCPVYPGAPVQLHEGLSVRMAPSNHPGISAIVRLDTDTGSFCVICDWEHGGQPVPRDMTDGCGFILYDGMFDDKEYGNRVGWGHSTWCEGVKLAKERGIPRLLISHHSPGHTDYMLRMMELEAQKAFAATRFVRIEDRYDMRGERL